MKGYIHSLESFGTVDGPGTRFVVFFQGCNLRCQYCHNPDTWKVKCAKEMGVEDILKEYKKVEEFINGGITISGGEPLLQLDFLIELLQAAKSEGIHTCVDTSGYAKITDTNRGRYLQLIEYTDLFLLDLKHIDDRVHRDFIGLSNQPILQFAQFLSDHNAPIWIRHVLVPGITQNDALLYKLGVFIGSLKSVQGVEVLPYHTYGAAKYEEMGIAYPLEGVPEASNRDAERARRIILLGRQGSLG